MRAVLRLEGAAAFAAAVALYGYAGFSWPLFALLFLAPDVAMLAYLIGPRAGALVYNLAHTYTLALPLALAGSYLGSAVAAALGLIWIAHIGLDRMLGYGLKYRRGSATRTSVASAEVETILSRIASPEGQAYEIHTFLRLHPCLMAWNWVRPLSMTIGPGLP